MSNEDITQSETTFNNLKSELKKILDPEYSILGHGTRLEAAPRILEEGLRARFPDLGTTTIPLIDSSKSIEEQANEAAETILNWGQLHSKAVILVQIPNPPENLGGFKYFNSVFRELDEPDTGYNSRYLIPSGYLRGYVDVEARKFIPNPLFNPEPLPTFKLHPSNK